MDCTDFTDAEFRRMGRARRIVPGLDRAIRGTASGDGDGNGFPGDVVIGVLSGQAARNSRRGERAALWCWALANKGVAKRPCLIHFRDPRATALVRSSEGGKEIASLRNTLASSEH